MHGPVFVGTKIPDMVLFGGKTDAKLWLERHLHADSTRKDLQSIDSCGTRS